MLIAGKLFTYLVLPPGGILLIVLFGGLLALRGGKRSVAVIVLAGAGLLYLLSIRPVADLLLAPLERKASLAPRAGTGSTGEPELIVVLGGGATVSRFTGSPTLLDASRARTVEAFILHRSSGLPLLLSGGVPLSRNFESEAETSATFLHSLGAEPASILLETASRSTWENAALVALATPIRSIYLVTSALHMRRSIECFVAHGFLVTPAPADFSARSAPYIFWDFLPDSGPFDDSASALHEYLGRIFYRIAYGGRGYRFTVQP